MATVIPDEIESLLAKKSSKRLSVVEDCQYDPEKKLFIPDKFISKLDKATRGRLVSVTIICGKAPTGQSKCRVCGGVIGKGEIRIGFPIKDQRGDWGLIAGWLHVKCSGKIVRSTGWAPDTTVEELQLPNIIHGWADLDDEQRAKATAELSTHTEEEELDTAEAAKRLDELVKRKLVERYKAPPELLLPLLPFQEEGLAWMCHQEESDCRGGILADEMGMGKTIQAVALLLKNKLEKDLTIDKPQGATLVVSPLAAVLQWKNEIERFTKAESLNVLIYHGQQRECLFDELQKVDVVITTYQTVEYDYRKIMNKHKVECQYCGKLYLPDKLISHQRYFCGPEAERTQKQKLQEKAKKAAAKKAMRTLDITKGDEGDGEGEGEGDGVEMEVGEPKKKAPRRKAKAEPKKKSTAVPTPSNVYRELMQKANRQDDMLLGWGAPRGAFGRRGGPSKTADGTPIDPDGDVQMQDVPHSNEQSSKNHDNHHSGGDGGIAQPAGVPAKSAAEANGDAGEQNGAGAARKRGATSGGAGGVGASGGGGSVRGKKARVEGDGDAEGADGEGQGENDEMNGVDRDGAEPSSSSAAAAAAAAASSSADDCIIVDEAHAGRGSRGNGASSSSGRFAYPSALSQLLSMGFAEDTAKIALQETKGHVDRATALLLGDTDAARADEDDEVWGDGEGLLADLAASLEQGRPAVMVVERKAVAKAGAGKLKKYLSLLHADTTGSKEQLRDRLYDLLFAGEEGGRATVPITLPPPRAPPQLDHSISKSGLAKLKVGEMKERLKQYGLPRSGTKPELLRRLERHLFPDSKPSNGGDEAASSSKAERVKKEKKKGTKGSATAPGSCGSGASSGRPKKAVNYLQGEEDDDDDFDEDRDDDGDLKVTSKKKKRAAKGGASKKGGKVSMKGKKGGKVSMKGKKGRSKKCCKDDDSDSSGSEFVPDDDSDEDDDQQQGQDGDAAAGEVDDDDMPIGEKASKGNKKKKAKAKPASAKCPSGESGKSSGKGGGGRLKKRGRDNDDPDEDEDNDDDEEAESDLDQSGVSLKDSPLHAILWQRIILDEAHRIKGRTTSTAKAVYGLKSSKSKWCLTGTPLQNRVGELYSLVRFLKFEPFAYYYCGKKGCDCKSLYFRFNENRYCSKCGCTRMQHFSYFNRRIVNPIKSYGYTGEGRIAMDHLKNEVLDKILLRRTKQERAEDVKLPPMTVKIRRDPLTKEEKDFYESLFMQTKTKFDAFVDKGTLLHNYAHIFDLLSRLRQAVDHPYLIVHGPLSNSLDAPLPSSSRATNMDICGLCQENVLLEERVVSKCHHSFHRACVEEYINSAPTDQEGETLGCPVCYVPLTVDLQSTVATPRVSPSDDGIEDPPAPAAAAAAAAASASASASAASGAANKGKGKRRGRGGEDDCDEDGEDTAKLEAQIREAVAKQAVKNVRAEQSGGANTSSSSNSKRGIMSRIDVNEFKSSTKIEALVQELEAMDKRDPEAKAIVFSQYTAMLDLIEWRLKKGSAFNCAKLVGSMSLVSRSNVLYAFNNDPSLRVVLISLKAGGEGLNLQVANHVFLMDPWWNPAAEMQAIQRCHRIGQLKEVIAIRFICKDTVEEKILELQEKKQLVFDGTVGANEGSLAKLTADDLAFLFRS
ncbi:unnamed protein product [Vitrella brassicaformis CCMP3155]|uniref:Uncharacterized protein n=3 Tax=Vitrella brassicaformis TaxID=1169539 RepID=A0A0G4EZB1_VITBC|nr:unnamed protein product [Vitrella brassicaformis CCMP3155]|eukprot:CEM04117.1 unnamed protein product [Vitrella brassicaformis CCMP3155]